MCVCVCVAECATPPVPSSAAGRPQSGPGARLSGRGGAGQRRGRRVKRSSHYHADGRAHNGASICCCQPLQIWCHPAAGDNRPPRLMKRPRLLLCEAAVAFTLTHSRSLSHICTSLSPSLFLCLPVSLSLSRSLSPSLTYTRKAYTFHLKREAERDRGRDRERERGRQREREKERAWAVN